MAKNKQVGLINIPCLAHVTVYTACMLVTYWLAGMRGDPISRQLLFVAVIFASHWLIDATNAAGHWTRIFHQSNTTMVRTMVDQTFHLVITGVLIEFVLL